MKHLRRGSPGWLIVHALAIAVVLLLGYFVRF